MAKDGQAKVLTDQEFATLLDTIEENRYPEKNSLIMQISFKLGLRAQEIALLRIREVAELSPQYTRGYKLKSMLVLPKSFTKGARAKKRATSEPKRTSVRFSLKEFDQLVKQIASMAKDGKTINPKDFYPTLKPAGGKTRELPIIDKALKKAIARYLDLRFEKNPNLKPNHPLILSQKDNAYSPNTLQDHMRLIMRNWAGIDRASSHSGRRTLATKLLHDQGEHLKTVQQILGHKNASTTVIYHDLPEEEIKRVLKQVGQSMEE